MPTESDLPTPILELLFHLAERPEPVSLGELPEHLRRDAVLNVAGRRGFVVRVIRYGASAGYQDGTTSVVGHSAGWQRAESDDPLERIYVMLTPKGRAWVEEQQLVGTADLAEGKLTRHGQDAQGASETAGDAEEIGDTGAKQGGKRWLAEAMLSVKDHPDWSDRKIAKDVGKSPSTLTRSPEYQAAAAMARGDKGDLPRGYIVPAEPGQPTDVEAQAPKAGDRIPGSQYYRGNCPVCGEDTRVESPELANTMPCERCR